MLDLLMGALHAEDVGAMKTNKELCVSSQTGLSGNYIWKSVSKVVFSSYTKTHVGSRVDRPSAF